MKNYKELISASTVSYLAKQFPDLAPAWIDAFPNEVDRLIEKWQLSPFGHEGNSRFGTIIYANSHMYGDVAVKIIPNFSSRLKSEILCYRSLPYKEMCALYDVDESFGALLLKYIPETTPRDKQREEQVFLSLYEQKREAANQDRFLPLYEDVFSEVSRNAVREIRLAKDESLVHLLSSIQKSEEGLNDFLNDKRYIIHGDAHEYNMLHECAGCVLIDPLGYIAPFEFERSRYLGTAMKHTEMDNDAFFALTARMLPKGERMKKQLTAFAIDTTLRACNTFIEGNTYEEICFAVDWAKRAWNYAAAYDC